MTRLPGGAIERPRPLRKAFLQPRQPLSGSVRSLRSIAALDLFSEPVRTWFSSSFPVPTAAQEQGWPAIASGEHTLILAPTGSGKTLTAFLWGIDRLATTPPPADKQRTRILYVSPLRALAVDVEKNLRAPLGGIRFAAERLGVPSYEPTVGVRTGDTPADERRKLIAHPPDLLITTPESLYLMLTSAARETLVNVEAVIVDEIHSLAATKRGAHLALTLERLEQRCERPPQRIGLSATQRPLEEIARFLGGFEDLRSRTTALRRQQLYRARTGRSRPPVGRARSPSSTPACASRSTSRSSSRSTTWASWARSPRSRCRVPPPRHRLASRSGRPSIPVCSSSSRSTARRSSS